MKHKSFSLIFILFFSTCLDAEIPEWYKRDIVNHVKKADAVILYKVLKVTKQSVKGMYSLYRIDTDTIQELKGSSPVGECYFIQTEGEWKSPMKIGEKAIVILNVKYQDQCGRIEPSFGAPATQEYIELFSSILDKSANQRYK